GAPRRGRRAHRPARDRRAAVRASDGRRRLGRDPLDRADAPGRARGLRGPRQSPQRGDTRGADPGSMIARYTRPELGALWTDTARMETGRQVEAAACEELPALLGDGGPAATELQAIRGATFTVQAVNEREQVTDHDMAAFVDVLAASAGESGRWIHFGLT